MKVPKISKTFAKVFENKYVLYFVFFLAILNLFGYLITGNFNAIAFFLLVGYLVYNFTKNMIVVLTVPIVLSSIFMVGKKIHESFQTSSASPSSDSVASASVASASVASASVASASPVKKTTSVAIQEDDDGATVSDTPIQTNSEEIGELGNDPGPKDGMTTMYKKGNRIDYASTIEDAYEDLGKVLGGDGIQRLTQDTQKLMKQQSTNALQNISPFEWNSQNQEQAMGVQEQAYINQARMSTYYQDNPFATLDFASQFGLNVMGGSVRGNLGSGSRPGNIVKDVPKPGFALSTAGYTPIRQPAPVNNIVPLDVQGINIPNFMVNFGSGYKPL